MRRAALLLERSAHTEDSNSRLLKSPTCCCPIGISIRRHRTSFSPSPRQQSCQGPDRFPADLNYREFSRIPDGATLERQRLRLMSKKATGVKSQQSQHIHIPHIQIFILLILEINNIILNNTHHHRAQGWRGGDEGQRGIDPLRPVRAHPGGAAHGRIGGL